MFDIFINLKKLKCSFNVIVSLMGSAGNPFIWKAKRHEKPSLITLITNVIRLIDFQIFSL